MIMRLKLRFENNGFIQLEAKLNYKIIKTKMKWNFIDFKIKEKEYNQLTMGCFLNKNNLQTITVKNSFRLGLEYL